MPPNDQKGSLKQWAKSLQPNWAALAKAATFVVAVLGTFLVSPPGLSFGDDRKFVQFAGFAVAVLIGLMFVPMFWWKLRRHTGWWWVLAALSFIATGLFFNAYDREQGLWTLPFQQAHRVVVGTEFKPDMKDVLPREVAHETLLAEYGGHAAALWPTIELEHRRRVLAWLYVGSMTCGAIAILALLHAIDCGRKPRTPRPASPDR